MSNFTKKMIFAVCGALIAFSASAGIVFPQVKSGDLRLKSTPDLVLAKQAKIADVKVAYRYTGLPYYRGSLTVQGRKGIPSHRKGLNVQGRKGIPSYRKGLNVQGRKGIPSYRKGFSGYTTGPSRPTGR